MAKGTPSSRGVMTRSRKMQASSSTTLTGSLEKKGSRRQVSIISMLSSASNVTQKKAVRVPSKQLKASRRTRRIDRFLNSIANSITVYRQDGTANALDKADKGKLRTYIEINLLQEHPDDAAQSWIDSCYEGKLLHSMLLDSGLDQYEPRSGTLIGSSFKGFALCAENNQRQKNDDRLLSANFLNRLRDGYGTEFIQKREFLPSLFIPINLSGSHWGYITDFPRSTSSDNREVDIYFGDSLGCKAPEGILETTKACLESLFLNVTWFVSASNHALDIMNYAKQRDGYSCGFYLLSAASTMSVSSGMMPDVQFEKRSKEVSEQYRTACVRALLTILLRAQETLDNRNLSDCHVLSYMSETQAECFKERRMRQISSEVNPELREEISGEHETISRTENDMKESSRPPVPDPAVETINLTPSTPLVAFDGDGEDSDDGLLCFSQELWSDEEEEEPSPEDGDILPAFSRTPEAGGQYSLAMVLIEGCDVVPAATEDHIGVNPRITHTYTGCTYVEMVGCDIAPLGQTERQELNETSLEFKPAQQEKIPDDVQKDNAMKDSTTSRTAIQGLQEQHVENLSAFVGELFDQGHRFGRAYTTVYKRRHRKQYKGKTRLRCLNYGNRTKCPSQIIAKRLRDGTGWTVRALLEHKSHGSNNQSSKRTKETQMASLEASIERHFCSNSDSSDEEYESNTPVHE